MAAVGSIVSGGIYCCSGRSTVADWRSNVVEGSIVGRGSIVAVEDQLLLREDLFF